MQLINVWATLGDTGNLETIGRIITIILGTSAIMLGFAKYVALPWLKSNLVEPVKEVNTQVTVNSHVSDPETMLDTIHTIETKIETLGENMHKIALDAAFIGASTGVIKGMWDHHLTWSEEEVKRIWKAIDRIDTREGSKHHDN